MASLRGESRLVRGETNRASWRGGTRPAALGVALGVVSGVAAPEVSQTLCTRRRGASSVCSVAGLLEEEEEEEEPAANSRSRAAAYEVPGP